MRNRVVKVTTMAALIGLTAGAQLGCQSTMDRPAMEAMEIADQNCTDAVLKNLEGSSPDKIDITEGNPLMQNGFIIMEWQALDRLAKGQCRMHEDGSFAEFIRYKE